MFVAHLIVFFKFPMDNICIYKQSSLFKWHSNSMCYKVICKAKSKVASSRHDNTAQQFRPKTKIQSTNVSSNLDLKLKLNQQRWQQFRAKPRILPTNVVKNSGLKPKSNQKMRGDCNSKVNSVGGNITPKVGNLHPRTP